MINKWWLCGAVLVSAVALAACGDDDDDGPSGGDDGGVDGGGAGTGSGGNGGSGGSGGNGGSGGSEETGGSGGSGGSGGNGGSGGTGSEAVECGTMTCPEVPAQAAMLGVTACCTMEDECGTMTPLAGVCLPPGAPGGVDPSCPDFDAGGLTTWVGCCTPDGECGALDSSEGGSGCIANELLMADEQSCTYDPNNTCQRIIDIQCDGNEDCGSGEQCCGRWDGGYRIAACMEVDNDCSELDASEGGVWSQLCHPGDTCEFDGYECLENEEFLPTYLYRCRDTGEEPGSAGSVASDEINCGSDTCGSGEKCCVSVPGLPVCVDEDEGCSCVSGEDTDAGSDDAGG